jgi:hypothetical protein
MRLSGGVLAVLIAGLVLGCNEKQTASTFEADVKELMTRTGSDSTALQMANCMSGSIISMVASQNPEPTQKQILAAKEEVDALLAEKMPGLLDRMSSIYKKHYTHEEVRQLLAFCKTRVGSKFASLAPTMSREGSQIGEEWARGMGPELEQRLTTRLQAEGLKLR